MAPPNKLLVLITGDPTASLTAERGNYGNFIQDACDFEGELECVDVRSALPPEHGDCPVIISGSTHNVHRREPWMLGCEAWLRGQRERARPILGICFGHQIMAQAFGGEVQKNPLGREMSTVLVSQLLDDPIFDGLPPSFSANACHSDTVVRLPESSTVLATSAGDPHQALRFGERLYGVQFHPEFDEDVMAVYIEVRREAIESEGFDVQQLSAQVGPTPDARRVITNFLKMC